MPRKEVIGLWSISCFLTQEHPERHPHQLLQARRGPPQVRYTVDDWLTWLVCCTVYPLYITHGLLSSQGSPVPEEWEEQPGPTGGHGWVHSTLLPLSSTALSHPFNKPLIQYSMFHALIHPSVLSILHCSLIFYFFRILLFVPYLSQDTTKLNALYSLNLFQRAYLFK